MTRLERELLTRIKARLDALDLGAAEKLAVLLPVLRRFAISYRLSLSIWCWLPW